MSDLRIIAAFVRRDWLVARSYRASLALSAVEGVLLLALFFYVSRLIPQIGGAVGEELGPDYFAFAVVGLALLGILYTGLDSLAGKLRQEQTTGTLETLLSTPAPLVALIVGSVAFDFLKAVAASAALMVLAVALFGLRLDVSAGSGLGAAAALFLTVLLFASVGVAVAAFTIVFKQARALLGLVATALALLGGVYFPLAVLPDPLRAVAEAIPFTWALEVLRAALLRGELALGRLLLLAAATAVAMPLAAWAFAAALRRARRDGSLAQY